MPADIVIIDYHKGNIASVERGLRDAGGRARIADDPDAIAAADALVLPGVGAFGDAMAYLTESGEAAAIRDAIAAGVPFLGICLGLQLLFDWGTEGADAVSGGRVRGLGILRGHCDELPRDAGVKVPHVGWDQVALTHAGRANPLTRAIPPNTNFYFTHSFAAHAEDDSCVLGTTAYARTFPGIVARDNVFATQFHPEKSSGAGQALLRAFMAIVDGKA